MDEKLKRLEEFNGQLKTYDGQLKEAEEWLLGGRKRMDGLIKPEEPIEVQERVMRTMDLQTDVQMEQEKFQAHIEFWENTLKPTEPGENTEEAQVDFLFLSFFVLHRSNSGACSLYRISINIYLHFQGFQKRIDTIKSTFAALYAEIKTECEKYGEDVKYLADFTGGCKKFEPWIQKSEAKKSVGMIKPKDLQEALDQLEDANVSYLSYTT